VLDSYQRKGDGPSGGMAESALVSKGLTHFLG